jgi:hypothetical protein
MLELLEWGAIAVAIYYFIKILNSAWFDSLLEGISDLLPESESKAQKEEREKQLKWQEELNRSMEESLKRKEKNANRSSYDLNEK